MKKILVFSVINQYYDSNCSVQNNWLNCYQTTDTQLSKLIEHLNIPIIRNTIYHKNKIDHLSYNGHSQIFVREENQIYEIKFDDQSFYRKFYNYLFKNKNKENTFFHQNIDFYEYSKDMYGYHYLKQDPIYNLWDNITSFIQNCELTSQNLNYLKLIDDHYWQNWEFNYYGNIKLPLFFVKNIDPKEIIDYENVINKDINDYEKISDLKLSKSLS